MVYLSRHDDVLASVELLGTSQVHGPVEKRDDIRVKSLPVRVLEVILLALYYVEEFICQLPGLFSFLDASICVADM